MDTSELSFGPGDMIFVVNFNSFLILSKAMLLKAKVNSHLYSEFLSGEAN